jgi:hypothetical protein
LYCTYIADVGFSSSSIISTIINFATAFDCALATTTGSAVSNVRAKGQFYELKLNFVPAPTAAK